MVTPRWGLTTNDNKVLILESDTGPKQIIVTSYEDAETFAQWLKIQKAGMVDPQAPKIADESDLNHRIPLAGIRHFPDFFPSRKDPEPQSH